MTTHSFGNISRQTRSLWGLAPVAPIHFGLDPLLVTLRQARGERVVVLADSHVAYLGRADAGEVAARTAYYRSYLVRCGLPAVTIAQTSDFLIDPVYVELLFGLFKTISTTAARNARPAAMKDYIVSEKLISLVSLAMQCADVFYMKADTVFSDPSQRHIYELLSDASPALLPATMPDFVYVPVACDLRGRHIFESTSATRITIHDDRHTVAQKVGKMYAPPVGQDIEPGREHALHAYFRWSVFPWRSHPVALDCEDGVRRQIADFETYLELYEGGLLHPRSCKLTLAEALSERIAGISERMDHSTFSWIRGIQQPPSCAAPNLAMIGAQ